MVSVKEKTKKQRKKINHIGAQHNEKVPNPENPQ